MKTARRPIKACFPGGEKGETVREGNLFAADTTGSGAGGATGGERAGFTSLGPATGLKAGKEPGNFIRLALGTGNFIAGGFWVQDQLFKFMIAV